MNFPSKGTNVRFLAKFLWHVQTTARGIVMIALSGGIALGSLCASVAANSAVGHWHQLANVQNWPRTLRSRRDDAGSTCSWYVPKAGLIDIVVLTCVTNV